MKRKIAIVALGIVLAAAVWLFVERRSADDGPVYQGKTARQWLNYIDPIDDTTNETQAYLAFHEMGSNAVPFLVSELQKNDSAFERFYQRVYPKIPEVVRKHLSRPELASESWGPASEMLCLCDSRTAIPDLIPMLSDTNVDRQRWALLGLSSSVGPADAQYIPVVINCVQSTNRSVCVIALQVLASMGPDARAVPALTNLVNSMDPNVRSFARKALKQIDPAIAKKYETSEQE